MIEEIICSLRVYCAESGLQKRVVKEGLFPQSVLGGIRFTDEGCQRGVVPSECIGQNQVYRRGLSKRGCSLSSLFSSSFFLRVRYKKKSGRKKCSLRRVASCGDEVDTNFSPRAVFW